MGKAVDEVMGDYIHRTERRVLYADTDSGGVVYYGNYLHFFEAGRTEILRANGASYRELEENGYILPVVECHIRYKASARYDDLLLVETSVHDVRKMSCRFNHRLSRVDDQRLLVKGYTVHACVDPQGKLTPFPDYFREKLRLIAGE
ncbi:MAG: thioesterase family protein [Desulfurivibrionaceae bacterium]|nr:thioesterase family protein [Desulfobulbales bacterium]MDT8334090.1 thioesterase family protein [Desulfurivibrionaceae bacterium]